MESSPQRWRSGFAAVLSAALLAACSSTSGIPPSRVGFPGETGETDALPEIADRPPLKVDETAEDIDLAPFAATRAALDRGDWMAARLALPGAAHTDADPQIADHRATSPSDHVGAQALWRRYYEARIAHLRGDLARHGELIAELSAAALPRALRKELLLHSLKLAQQSGNFRAQFQVAARLQAAGGHPLYEPAALEDSLWRAAQGLSDGERKALRRSSDEEARAWLDLAAAAAQGNPLDSVAALTAWETEHPAHAGRSRASALRDAAMRDTQTTQLGLILPLSGPLEKAGDAVSRGFIAAYYADPSPDISLDIIDSRRFGDSNAAYANALERGADLVVGPLGKQQVETLLRAQALPVPLLTLNRPETEIPMNPAALLLSLAPEDEARQLAEQAFARGARRAFLIRPEGSWGDRMEEALVTHWRRLGGQLPTTAVYGKPPSYSNALRDALGLGASAERSTGVRALFNEPVETAERRRKDLDAIFLLSANSEEARALKPLINYHYAGDLPVYALSTADTGSNNSALNQDLGGLQLLVMPWRLDQGILPGDASDAGSSFAALHALGADAYALTRRWWRMRSEAAPLYSGLTAQLSRGADGSLIRRLSMAEFDRGNLRPR